MAYIGIVEPSVVEGARSGMSVVGQLQQAKREQATRSMLEASRLREVAADAAQKGNRVQQKFLEDQANSIAQPYSRLNAAGQSEFTPGSYYPRNDPAGQEMADSQNAYDQWRLYSVDAPTGSITGNTYGPSYSNNIYSRLWQTSQDYNKNPVPANYDAWLRANQQYEQARSNANFLDEIRSRWIRRQR